MAAIPAPSPSEIVSQRDLPFAPELVFRAFAEPARLAEWWGPAGFTNEIRVFELRPGGAWRLTMTGPDGTRFENLSRFDTIEAPARVAFVHEDPVHRFRMSMTFDALDAGTRLVWHMRFDDPAEAGRVRDFVVAANEQNFDRLQRHLEQNP